MHRKLSVLLVIVVSILALAITAMAQPHPKVQALLAEARAAVTTVTAEEAKAALDAKEDALFLDVRDPDEYAGGHIPGSRNISRGKLEFQVFNAIPDQNTKIYVYCLTAARSALATKTLNDLGYENAVLINASWADWVKAGYPVAR